MCLSSTVVFNEGGVGAAGLNRLYVSDHYCSSSSRVVVGDITPEGFSDHHIVTVNIHLSCP